MAAIGIIHDEATVRAEIQHPLSALILEEL